MQQKPSKHHKNKAHQNHRKNYAGKHFASIGQGSIPTRGAFTRRRPLSQNDNEEDEDLSRYEKREIQSNAYRFEENVTEDDEALETDEQILTGDQNLSTTIIKQRKQQMQMLHMLLEDSGGGSAYSKKPWEKEWDVNTSEPFVSVLSVDTMQLYNDIGLLSVEKRLHLEEHEDNLDPVMRLSLLVDQNQANSSQTRQFETKNLLPLSIYKDGSNDEKIVHQTFIYEHVSDSDEDIEPVPVVKKPEIQVKQTHSSLQKEKPVIQQCERKLIKKDVILAPKQQPKKIERTTESQDIELLDELIAMGSDNATTTAPLTEIPAIIQQELRFDKPKLASIIQESTAKQPTKEDLDDWLDDLTK